MNDLYLENGDKEKCQISYAFSFCESADEQVLRDRPVCPPYCMLQSVSVQAITWTKSDDFQSKPF